MSILTFSLLLTSCFLSLQSLKVTDSGFSFTLEAVKTLKMMMEDVRSNDPHLTQGTKQPLCANPNLPAEFLEVCQQDNHYTIFKNLVNIMNSKDVCEICANAACTGCLFNN